MFVRAVGRFFKGIVQRTATPEAVGIMESPVGVTRRELFVAVPAVAAGLTLVACGKEIPFDGPKGATEIAFEKKYADTTKIVIDQPFMKQANLSLSSLQDPTNGWTALSKALYGTGNYASYLKRFNGGAESPMAAKSTWVNDLFCRLSDDYCAAVVNIRVKRGWINTSGAKVVQPRKRPDGMRPEPGMARPRPMGTRRPMRRPNGMVRRPNGMSAAKPSLSLWPRSARVGTTGWITITLKNYTLTDEADVTVVRSSGIDIDAVKKRGSNKIRVKVNLTDDAVVKTHTLKVYDGRKLVGTVRFTVKRK
jgi:hypothetical protein